MKKILLAVLLTLIAALSSHAQIQKSKVVGYVERGGLVVKVSPTTNYKVQQSFPLSTITIYQAGTITLASIYSDNIGSPKSNPFVSDSVAYYDFYADTGIYDIKFSGTGITAPFTLSGVSVPGILAASSVPLSDLASLPTAGTHGRISKLTDSTRSLVVDTGTRWTDLTGKVYNIELYGAIDDGVFDNTAIIQSVIDTVGLAGGGIVEIPATSICYKTTSLITIAYNNVRVVGHGWASRICNASTTDGTFLLSNGLSGFPSPFMENPTFLSGCGIENVRLEPLVTRTSGWEIAAYRFNNLYLNQLVIINTYGGILLGRNSDIAISIHLNQLTMRGYKFGIKMVHMIDGFCDGWALDKYDHTNNTYSLWLSGLTSGITLSNSEIVNSKYAEVGPTGNNVYALYLHDDTGVGGAVLLANFFVNSFFDSHTRGLVADHGTGNNFTNCWFSDVGVGTGSTPGIGVSINGGTDWGFNNCYWMNNGGPGVYVGGAGVVSIIGGAVAGNNQQGYPASSPYSAGIYLNQGAGGHVRIIGVGSRKNLSIFPANNQEFGIWDNASGGDYDISHCYLKDNNTGPMGNWTPASLSTTKRVTENEGLILKNSGSASIPNGATSLVVPHGLSFAPNGKNIRITPINTTNQVFYYITATTSTTFTITLSGDPGASGWLFGWKAEIE